MSVPAANPRRKGIAHKKMESPASSAYDARMAGLYGDTVRIKRVFTWLTTLVLFGLFAGIFIVLTTKNIFGAAFMGLCLIPILASYYFIHRLQFEIVAAFLATIMIFMNTVLATRGLGIHHISNLAFPAILIVASLVTRKRTMIFLTGLSIACVAWLVFGEIYGLYKPAVLVHSVPGDFLSAALTIVLTALMVRLITVSLFQTSQQVQQELKERRSAEEKYRSIFENALDGIFQVSPEGKFMSVNPAMARMYGYETPEEMIGLQAPKQLPFGVAMDAQPMNQRVEMQDVRRDGTVFWKSVNVRAVHGPDGAVAYYEGMQEDVTGRKQAEENLRQREAILSAVAGSAEMLFKTYAWEQDIDFFLERLGKAINASHAYFFEHFTDPDGIVRGTMRAEWSAPPLPSDLEDSFYQDLPVLEPGLERWYELLESGQPYIGDVLHATPSELEIIRARDMEAVLDVPIVVNGKWWGVIGFDEVRYQRIWTSAEVDALRIATNVLSAAIQRQMDEAALQNELTQRKSLIDELESKNQELEQFTYTVSHDLKAPIITIKGFLGFLERDLSSGNVARVHEDSQRIHEAVDKMNLLLGELLELSRIGRMMNPPEMVSMGQLVQDALDILHGRLAESRAAVQTQPDLPAVYGDRHRLTEVLQNLIENAAKFMGAQKSPHIEIGLQAQENGRATFYVRDNGMGIDPQYHERIFGLFNKLNAETEGTGIGLALVKRIVEFHDGRIWVESEVGKGSTFYFVLKTSPG